MSIQNVTPAIGAPSDEPQLVAIPDRTDWVCLCVLAALVAVFGLAVTRRMVAAGLDADFAFHIQLAQTIAHSRQISSPEFIWHITTIVTHLVLHGISYSSAGTIVTVAYDVLLSAIVYLVIRPVFGPGASTLSAGIITMLLAAALMLVTPVTLPTWQQHNLYFGYIGINVYHNPTITVLKPFALLLSVAAVRIFEVARSRSLPVVLAAGGLVALATVAKPNYTLCLLPALAVLVAFRLWHHQHIDWLLLLGIVGPALGVLVWQYFLAYGLGNAILFAPFQVFLRFTSAVSLLPKLILSMLFPLGVYLLYFQSARRALYLNLCWSVFVVGLGFNYLLAEAGDRMYHANFAWGAQAALFILFVASVRFWLLQLRAPQRPEVVPYRTGRAWLIAGILGLHLVSGLVWYYTQLTSAPAHWW